MDPADITLAYARYSKYMKRVFLFLATNLLIGTLLVGVTSALGVRNWASEAGINYWMLMASSMIYGFAGSFISLALSRTIAKWINGVKLVTGNEYGPAGQVYRDVAELAERAGLPVCPEVGIYESDEINAFATGPSKSRALVAVSSSLLTSLPQDQIKAILAHEVSHIQNGDMVTMALLQGVINSFAIFLARILAYAASLAVDSRLSNLVYFAVNIVCQLLFTFLGSFITMAFSRKREFRADAGAANLVGAPSMAEALKSLQRVYKPMDVNSGLQTAKIAGAKSWLQLLSSHPPIEDRIAALNTL